MINKETEDVARFYDERAVSYDTKLHSGFISSLIRKCLLKKLGESFSAGNHLLDIGCGTGDDAIYLAGRGIKITAVDISPKMLELAAKKIKDKNLNDMIDLKLLDAENLSSLNNYSFDGAYSNFNAVNHLKNPKNFGKQLSGILKPSSKFMAVMLNKLCFSEVLAYSIKLRVPTAVRKLTGRDKGFPSYIKLYFPRQVKKIFAENFKLNSVSGFGFLVPPDQFYNGKNYLSFFKNAARLESHFTGSYPFYNFCDHCLMEFQKK